MRIRPASAMRARAPDTGVCARATVNVARAIALATIVVLSPFVLGPAAAFQRTRDHERTKHQAPSTKDRVMAVSIRAACGAPVFSAFTRSMSRRDVFHSYEAGTQC